MLICSLYLNVFQEATEEKKCIREHFLKNIKCELIFPFLQTAREGSNIGKRILQDRKNKTIKQPKITLRYLHLPCDKSGA